jgi:hypothetical protein
MKRAHNFTEDRPHHALRWQTPAEPVAAHTAHPAEEHHGEQILMRCTASHARGHTLGAEAGAAGPTEVRSPRGRLASVERRGRLPGGRRWGKGGTLRLLVSNRAGDPTAGDRATRRGMVSCVLTLWGLRLGKPVQGAQLTAEATTLLSDLSDAYRRVQSVLTGMATVPPYPYPVARSSETRIRSRSVTLLDIWHTLPPSRPRSPGTGTVRLCPTSTAAPTGRAHRPCRANPGPV